MSMKAKSVLHIRQSSLDLLGMTSKRRTASALIYTGACVILGIKITTDRTTDVTVNIYDNTSATGDIWDDFPINGADGIGGIIYPKPMPIENGIYVSLSGANGAYTVYYSELL